MSSNAFAQIEREENEAEALREHMKIERKAEQNELKEEGNEMTASNKIIADLQTRNAELVAQLRAEWRKPDSKPPEMDRAADLIEMQAAKLDAIRAQEPVAIVKHVLGGPAVHLIGDVKPQDLLYTHAPDSAARIAELERERDVALGEVKESTHRLNRQIEVHGYENERLRLRIEMLTDPFVRAFLRELAPSIVVNSGESQIAALKSALREALEVLDIHRDVYGATTRDVKAIATIKTALGEEL